MLEAAMMAIEKRITTGNVINLAAQVVSLLAIVVGMTLAYAGAKQEIALLDQRVRSIEAHEQVRKNDHDLLIEIRQDLRILRSQVDAIAGRRFGAADMPGSKSVTFGSKSHITQD
jgi:type VI protein secretion system component VasK